MKTKPPLLDSATSSCRWPQGRAVGHPPQADGRPVATSLVVCGRGGMAVFLQLCLAACGAHVSRRQRRVPGPLPGAISDPRLTVCHAWSARCPSTAVDNAVCRVAGRRQVKPRRLPDPWHNLPVILTAVEIRRAPAHAGGYHPGAPQPACRIPTVGRLRERPGLSAWLSGNRFNGKGAYGARGGPLRPPPTPLRCAFGGRLIWRGLLGPPPDGLQPATPAPNSAHVP